MSAAMQMQVGMMSSQRPMPELDEQQFARWAGLLEQRLGINVMPQRKASLYSKQPRGARELVGVKDFERDDEVVTFPCCNVK